VANNKFRVRDGLEVVGDTSITGTLTANAVVANDISSADSSAIQINDGVNISGTLNAKTLITNTIGSEDSSAIEINDGLTVSGSFTANAIQTNNISSSESSAIQINDAVNVSGALTANTLKTDSTATISGTLTANTIVTNDISSADSTAVQINDGVNISGTLTANSTVTFNAGYVERINALTAGTTITINCALAPVHKVTLTTNTGFVITSLPTGGSVTVIIVQDGTGSRTATFGTDTSTAVKFAGGTPTLSTAASSIDIVTIFNDGTNYYGDIGKAYA